MNAYPAPERIWLQIDSEGACDVGDWCEDQIYETDVEYVRADVAHAQYQVAAYTDKEGMALYHNDFPGAVPLYIKEQDK